MKRRTFAILAVLLVLAVVAVAVYYSTTQTPSQSSIVPEAPTWTAGSLYEVYFTDPQYPDVRANHKGGLDEKLVAFLNTASQTIDVAIYDLDLENVADALIAAGRRGVTVRLVTDTDNLDNDAVQRLIKAGVPVVDDRREAIMHDKFAVVDKQAAWTGSWNFTVNDTYRYNNNAVLIRSKELAQNYTWEFENMFVQKSFGPSKPKGTPYNKLTVGGIAVENYFSPEDKPASHIVPRIQAARSSIRFMAFSFTHDDLGQAVLDRSKAGVAVRGVFETTGSDTKYSEYGRLKGAGLDVLQDGNPYLMHHKVFIIDDRTVVFGSFNFSAGANEDNDENLLIVDDPALARAFNAEFDKVYSRAKNPINK